MLIPHRRQIRLAGIVICAALLGVAIDGFVAAPLAASQGENRGADDASPREGSRITGLAVAGSQPTGNLRRLSQREKAGSTIWELAVRRGKMAERKPSTAKS